MDPQVKAKPNCRDPAKPSFSDPKVKAKPNFSDPKEKAKLNWIPR